MTEHNNRLTSTTQLNPNHAFILPSVNEVPANKMRVAGHTGILSFLVAPFERSLPTSPWPHDASGLWLMQ